MARMAAKILLVEDDPLTAAKLAAQLCGLGHVVVGPADTLEAAEALAAVQAPDLALLDFDVGGATSVELAVSLSASGVAVAFCTGHASIPGLPPALKSAPLLTKPVSDAALRETLKQLLG